MCTKLSFILFIHSVCIDYIEIHTYMMMDQPVYFTLLRYNN